MAEVVKKAVKTEKPKIDEKATKDAAKATLHALAKPSAQKAVVTSVKPQSEVVAKAPAELQAQPPKVIAPIKIEPAAKAETKPEVRKEADPGKEFVDSIMTEMALKGASKKRLIKKLAEQFNFDKQKVLFRLKRALITERYAAVHEAGH
jgi:uncharacterized protein YggU (UPF0235/DUF167 family)